MTRSYNSPSRAEQASQTRTRILESARQLFQQDGFDRVTIGQLAQEAGVSAPTIYAQFKSKRGVLQAMMDAALPAQQFQALVDEAMQEPSPTKRLQITAKTARQIYDAERELMDLLRGAALVSPEIKELEQQREQRRYERQSDYANKLAADGVLAPSLTVAQARDILWAMTGRDLYRLLVIDRGWSSDQYEAWLAEQLTASLLA